MKDGWIKLYRKLRDNEIWSKNKTFDNRSAWIDLLLRATHLETKFLFGNTIIKLEPGQILTSGKSLSKEWKWSRHKVKNFLSLLQELNQIGTPIRTSRYTIITITNWELHQSRELEKDTEKDIKRTSKGHQKDTYKNNKNVKNKKDINKLISYVGLKPNFVMIISYLNEKTGRNFSPANKSTTDLMRARFNEGRTVKDFQTVIDKKVKDWLTDDKMNVYLRPSTLFNRTKFENYLNEPRKDKFAKYLKKEEK